MIIMNLKRFAVAIAIGGLMTPAVFGDYLTATIDGDTSEWAGVPVFATDAVDNAGAIDFTSLQIANDENFIYVRYVVNESISSANFSGVFKSVDEDVDVATGFDIFTLGVVGAESSWQGDFPFENATGVYNTGNGLTSVVNLMSSLQTSTGTLDVEFAIDRSTIHTAGGANVFPADGGQISFALWTDQGAGDLIGGGAYTLATTPPPPSNFLTATIDGNTSEWAGIPVFATDAADNAGSIDFTSIQIANDENFVYVRYLINESISSADIAGVFKSVDEDSDVTTGFDVFTLGAIGAESSWQGDFPFENATGVFNTGNGLTSAVNLMSSLQTSAGTLDVEFAIDRTTIHTVGGANVFPADGGQFNFAMWTDQGAGDLIGGGTYAMASGTSVLLGDVDLNGTVEFLDIAPFIALLSSATYQAEADCNEDGSLTFLDIAPFIAILSSQ